MRYSSEEPSKKIPRQEPSLNHSLLWVFAAVGPAGQSDGGLTGLCSPKATPVSITSAPTPATSTVLNLLRLSIRVILAFGTRSSRLCCSGILYTNRGGS